MDSVDGVDSVDGIPLLPSLNQKQTKGTKMGDRVFDQIRLPQCLMVMKTKTVRICGGILAAMAALLAVSLVLPATATQKRHATRIQTVNSLASVKFPVYLLNDSNGVIKVFGPAAATKR